MTESTATNAAKSFRGGLIAFAGQAAERLERSTQEGKEDLAGISDGLRDALDSAAVLERAAESGVELSWALVDEVERLVRAALSAYHFLQKTEIEIAQHGLESGRDIVGEEGREKVAALRARSLKATRSLHRGLEGAYRNLMDSEEES